MSADNQQGRLSDALCYYIAGFVDGEGSFHIAIQKSLNVKMGWQVIPEFHVSQNQDRIVVSEAIQKVFGCGYIRPNHRTRKNDNTFVFVVRNHRDLKERVIPFFKKFKLISAKNDDFCKFAAVVEMITRDSHLQREGLKEIIKIAFSMNNNGKNRKLKISNIVNSF